LNDLSSKYNIPHSQKKTYNIIVKVGRNAAINFHIGSYKFLGLEFLDSTILSKIKDRNIYKVIPQEDFIIKDVNNMLLNFILLPGKSTLISFGKLDWYQDQVF